MDGITCRGQKAGRSQYFSDSCGRLHRRHSCVRRGMAGGPSFKRDALGRDDPRQRNLLHAICAIYAVSVSAQGGETLRRCGRRHPLTDSMRVCVRCDDALL